MRDAEDELPQHESAVEITPLPQEKEAPEAQQLSPRMVHESARQLGRANRSGTMRYILTSLALCLVLALFLTIVVVQLHQPAKPSSHASSLVASPTATPAYVPTDYSVNTMIVNGVVYAGAANGAVYALRASDGNVLWHHKISTGASAAPLVNDGIIYITTSISDVGPGSLYALRASDGTQLWHETARGFSYNAPVVDNQVVYVSASADNGSGTVYALRADNGAQLWHYATTTFTSVPLVVNGIAYLISDQGLSALRASDGQLLWRVPVEGNTNISPQVKNGVLYLTTTKISLEASATPTNQVSSLPQVGMIGNLLQSVVPKAPVKQKVPLKQGLSSVYAVRISDGTVLWHYSMSNEKGNNWANWFSIENGTVYVGTYVDQDKSYIYALRSSDGSLLWRHAMYRGMSINAFVANGVIYIASFINNGSINDGSGAVYALRSNDGAQLWYHPMYWVVYNPPMLVGATIYVSTAGGEVYAFQASNGSALWHFHTDVQ